MATGPFPEDAQRRKAIFVLGRPEIDRCEYTEGGPDLLLNEEIHILEYPLQDASGIVQDIDDRGLVRPGAVLVQSPFDGDRYESVMEARNLFALEKRYHFSTFCMHLGARRVAIEEIWLRKGEETKTWKAEVGGGISKFVASVGAKANQDECDIEEWRLILVDTFKGEQGSLKDAEKLLRQTNLFGDPSMSELLKMCRSRNNQLRSRTLTLNLSSEVTRKLNVIGGLQIPRFVKVKLEAGYERVVHEHSEYKLILNICF